MKGKIRNTTCHPSSEKLALRHDRGANVWVILDRAALLLQNGPPRKKLVGLRPRVERIAHGSEAAKVLTRDELADCHKLLAFASTTCRAFQKAPFTRAARLASCSVEPLLISTPAFARMVAAASRVAVRAGML